MTKFSKLFALLLIYTNVTAQIAPSISINSSATSACTGIPIKFAAVSSASVAEYSWTVTPNSGIVISSLTDSILEVTFSRNITYTLSLSITSGTQQSTVKRLVPVNITAKSSFNASLRYSGYPTELELTNYSSSALHHIWIFSDQAKVDSSLNTIKPYAAGGDYTVSLVAIGLRGCNDTSSYAFSISDSSHVTLPNVFSPNDDGVNDFFKPITVGISALNGYIYSRQGILIYKWNTVNGFWDGRTTSGELCPNGTYVAVVEAYGFDSKTYKLSNFVSLFR